MLAYLVTPGGQAEMMNISIERNQGETCSEEDVVP